MMDESEIRQIKAENERLKTDSRRFANIINLSANAIWQRNEQLALVYCNLAFMEIAEQSGDESESMQDTELFSGEREACKKAWTSNEERVFEHYIVVDGERRLYRIRLTVSHADNTITGYAVDITDQDLIRDEVQRHISAQHDFLESSTSAMAIFGSDMRLQSYNFAFVALWKLEEGWLDTAPTYGEILEALREKRRLPEQSNFPAFKQQQLKLFNALIEPHEEFFYLPDEKIIRVLAIPHALGGLLFAYEDVTDRLALERSYNTLIAVQRETLDNLHEGVVVVGMNGRIKLSNPNFASLWKLQERYLSTDPHVREVLDLCRDYFDEDNWDLFKNDFVGRLQNRTPQSGRIERTDGIALDWRIVPLPDGGTLLTYTDVTDTTLLERSLRERNDALEAADRLKSEFLANVSYELRSPLTSISGFSDILRNEYFGKLTDKQAEYVEGIHQSSQHLGQLINNILDLASIEAGYMQLDISEIDVFDMLEGVLLLLKERLKVLDLTIHKDCSPSIGSIYADETRMKQVLFNLLSNAVKYSKAGGVIEVGASPQGEEHLCVWVKDQGVGIEEGQHLAVFDKFYRAGASSGQQSGSGLGLSIVKSFIELHGGSVSLTSVAGEGTTVSCILPRRPKNPV